MNDAPPESKILELSKTLEELRPIICAIAILAELEKPPLRITFGVG